MKNLPEVILKKGEEDRVIAGHPWIYDNEIDQISDTYENGGLFLFKNSEGLYIGLGYVNEKSVITGRMLDTLKKPAGTYANYPDIESLIIDKIKIAVKKRDKVQNTDAIRYVYSEADSLPGLIVDKYAGTLVVQITTLGIEKLKPVIIKALDDILKPEVIYEKSISQSRSKEGLEKTEGAIKGTIKPIIITENGIKFEVNPVSGSKTGFYLDQRDNREKLKDFVKGKDVLDLFCYTGGFAAYGCKYGAKSVKAVDSSAAAIDAAGRNMEMNGLENYCLIKSDVFDELKAAALKGEKYDVVILDPPPFSKTKEEKAGGIKGYRDLHNKAFKVLNTGGVIFTFSCSHNISMAELIKSAKDAARFMKCRVEIAGQMFQAKDHPYSTQIPETFYLKGAIIRKL
jgi:23S rRNA (cytosine1962-C5)-methyltransferase